MQEYNTLQNNVTTIIGLLDGAILTNHDIPDDVNLEVAWYDYTGDSGRPRLEIDPNFLEFALQTRGFTEIASFFGCSARTIRRRALESRLAPAGQRPFLSIDQPDGDVDHIWNGPIRHTRLSAISEEDLDRAITEILLVAPTYGRRMIDGALRSRGIHVAMRRINAAYRRVHGPPAGFFDHRLERRTYTVAGVNSVWHHDGQHGNVI
jgi:hypothetical protein